MNLDYFEYTLSANIKPETKGKQFCPYMTMRNCRQCDRTKMSKQFFLFRTALISVQWST